MPTFTDNLDGTAGDLLSSRSGWSRPVGSDDAKVVSSGSGIALAPNAGAASTGTWHAPSSQPSGNDEYVEAYIGAVANAFPLGVRCDTSVATGGGYLARCTASNVIELFRRSSSGVLLNIGSYTVPTPSDLTTNKVKLEVVGTTLNVYFKGSAVIGPVTRTDFSSGSVAMLSRGGTASTTVYTIDDIGWGDTGAAGVTGDASVSVSFDVAGAGAAIIAGTSATSIDFTASAAGAVANTGAASGTVDFSVAADGTVATAGAITGTAALTVPFTTTSIGAVKVAGTAAGTVDFTASGAGTVASAGSASFSGTVDFTAASAGAVKIAGAGAGSITFAATAAGAVKITGVSSASVTFACSATIGNAANDEQYPLAGLSQGYPLAGQAQQYPLYGRAA